MTQPTPTSEGQIATALRGVKRDEYGPSHREHVIRIYETYLEMADRTSGRREKANAFFLTVNTALIALLAGDTLVDSTTTRCTIGLLLPAVGGVLCYLWHRIIRSYRDLNSAKFKVLHAIERELPLRPYDAEWENVGRGRDPKRYLPFTHVEGIVPWLFMVFHAIMFVIGVPWTVILTAIRWTG